MFVCLHTESQHIFQLTDTLYFVETSESAGTRALKHTHPYAVMAVTLFFSIRDYKMKLSGYITVKIPVKSFTLTVWGVDLFAVLPGV